MMSESEENCDDESYEPRKRGKADRISGLPDALIIHILSFLHMKQVVQTGVLSKRWHLLWTCAHTFIFTHSGFQERDTNKFLTFIDDTLLVSKPSKLKKFSVEFSYGKHFVRHVNRWMIFIKNKYVEEIDLYLKQRGLSDNYSLPQLMYSNMWLQELHLCNCNLVPKGEINWPALRVLEIKDAELSQDIIKKICSGCPALESLKFNDCSGVCLNIDSKSLKKLVIDGSWYDDDDNEEEELKIYARNVTSLEISGYFHNKRPVLGNVQTVVDAKLDFCRKTDDYEDDENDFTSDQTMLKELLVSLQHVEKLSIGYWCLQVLTILEMRNWSCPMMRCKYLTLNTRVKKWVLPGIAVLLQSCPQVEILNINMETPSEDEYFFGSYFEKSNDFNEEKYWISRPCWVLHLKTLRIDGFWTYVDYSDENILLFLQVVLKNALVLQKISIDSLEDDMWIFSGDYKKVAEKLLSFPRSSKDAVILFSG